MNREAANKIVELALQQVQEISRHERICQSDSIYMYPHLRISLDMLRVQKNRLQAILKLLLEVPFMDNTIVLPSFSIARSIYEMMALHHSFFVAAKTEEETMILISIWKAKCLIQKLKYKIPSNITIEKQLHNEEKVNNCKRELEELTAAITSSALYKQSQEEIDKALGTDHIGYFRFVENNGRAQLQRKSFGDDTLFETIFGEWNYNELKDVERNMAYHLLSSHSHPTYLSIEEIRCADQMGITQLYSPLQNAVLFIHNMILTHYELLKKHKYENEFSSI